MNGVSILGACVAFIHLKVPSSSSPGTRSVPVKPLLDKGFREGPNLRWIFETENRDFSIEIFELGRALETVDS